MSFSLNDLILVSERAAAENILKSALVENIVPNTISPTTLFEDVLSRIFQVLEDCIKEVVSIENTTFGSTMITNNISIHNLVITAPIVLLAITIGCSVIDAGKGRQSFIQSNLIKQHIDFNFDERASSFYNDPWLSLCNVCNNVRTKVANFTTPTPQINKIEEAQSPVSELDSQTSYAIATDNQSHQNEEESKAEQQLSNTAPEIQQQSNAECVDEDTKVSSEYQQESSEQLPSSTKTEEISTKTEKESSDTSTVNDDSAQKQFTSPAKSPDQSTSKILSSAAAAIQQSKTDEEHAREEQTHELSSATVVEENVDVLLYGVLASLVFAIGTVIYHILKLIKTVNRKYYRSSSSVTIRRN